MKQNKAAGTRRELQEVKLWQERGYVAFRTPASMGVCDVIAMRRAFNFYAELVFVECKSNRGSAFMNFRQLDREALKLAAQAAGATPLLVHWPPHGERRQIPADDWPEPVPVKAVAA